MAENEKRKIALVTGATGQDGSYLIELLLEKGYEVHGVIRRASTFNTHRIDHIFQDPHEKDLRLILHYGDLADANTIRKLIYKIKPDEIYNLGAQSHVRVSFDIPEYTANITGLGTLRLLEAIKDFEEHTGKKVKFYQASSSEMFGAAKPPQNESTPFQPRSPYGIAKIFSFYTTKNYREAYGIFGVNGILFNHESPRRGETFVTRKITRGLANIAQGVEHCLYMGNMDSLRDWGHAKDYVKMQWLMLQQEHPEDFVIATGLQFSVRQFITWSAAELGIALEFVGKGAQEQAMVKSVSGDKAPALKTGDVIVRVDPRYFRPTEVDTLLGDPAKAKSRLGWMPEITVQEMCAEMVAHDLEEARRHALLKAHGYSVAVSKER